MPYTPNRRDFLRLTAAAALGPALLACEEEDGSVSADAAATPDAAPIFEVDDAAFPYAVQAGAMEAEAALLWTFAADGAPKRLRVWAEEGAPPVYDAVVEGADGFLEARVQGLRPGTLHRYAFFDDARGARSVEGRFTTAWAPGERRPVRVGATACTASGRAPFPALRLLADRPLDVFCHLGDFSYNDPAVTRADYREQWAETLSLPDYRALLPTVGSYITLDDHEVANDSRLYGLDPANRAAGLDAFFEHTPVPRLPGDRFWNSYRWGDSVEFFVLDVRMERVPEADLFVSPAQLDWLVEALRASPCHFKTVLTSVPIARLPVIWALQSDRWEGFPAQRDRLLDAITGADGGAPVENVWFLAGDFHLGAVWRVEPAGPRSAIYEILVGPGGSGPSRRHLLASANDESWALFYPPEQVEWAYGDWVATFLTFDPEADTVLVENVDARSEEVVYRATLRQER